VAKEKTDADIADAPPAPTPEERVESWKDIAAYLQRDVRTVQRWEKKEALPVYRHMHDKLGTVYAYKAELDAWWNNRRPKLEAKEAAEAEQAKKGWKWWAVATAAAATVAAGVGLWLWLGQEPALPFAERDWVLIAAFENRTGEEVFDGTLEYALERELSNSRFVNVVPRERINDSLELMKKPLETRLDPAIAREVALRDGGIRALLTGRVEKLDNTYVLSASLVNPANGLRVASFSEDARGQREVVPAVRRLSGHVRESVGEKLSGIQASAATLEKATTPSLRALQLYSLGMDRVYEDEMEQAAEILQRAIAEDPDFASAHILLAHCLSNLGRKDAAAPHYQRAFALADKTSDHERYFIYGSYYQRFTRELEKAAQAYETLVRLHPDHFWGVNNLAFNLSQLNRGPEVLQYRLRLAELRPNDFSAIVYAARAALVLNNDMAMAQRYMDRARALLPSADPASHEAVFVRLFPAYTQWHQGNVMGMQQELTRAQNSFDGLQVQDRTTIELALGLFYMTLGRFGKAEERFRRIPDPSFRHANLAVLAFARNDKEALLENLRPLKPSYTSAMIAVLFIRAGLLRQAETRLSALAPVRLPAEVASVRGELALAQGRMADAEPLLRDGLQLMQAEQLNPVFFLAAESLATLYVQQGETQKALETLETAGMKRGPQLSYFGLFGYFGMRPRVELARLYRWLGREAEAQKIEVELLKLLALADPDHPILLELQRRREAAAAQPTP